MAVPVRIEAKAWTDPRYQALAIELGMTRARHALIAVADIWQWQTLHYTDEQPTYCVPRAVIVGALESKRGPEAMVAAELAEAMPDGTYRIRGGRDDRGNSRIDWLWAERRQRQAAGEASAKRRRAAGDPRAAGGRFGDLPPGHQRATNGPPTGHQRTPNEPTNGDQALCSLISDLRSDQISLSPARATPGAVDPPDGQPEQMGPLVDHAIDRLNAARRKVDPDAAPIPLIADQPCRELLEHLRPIDAGQRKAVLDHAIDVMVATLDAGREPVGQYRMAMLAGPKSWPRWRDGTVAGARGRDGPSGRATGRAPPARIDSTDEIDPTTIRPRARA